MDSDSSTLYVGCTLTENIASNLMYLFWNSAKVVMIDMLASTTEHSHGVVLVLLLKLLYPKGALKAIFIKKFEVSDSDKEQRKGIL